MERTLHEEVLIASVATRFVNIQWYVGGIPILNNAGNISLSALCRWPFPLPRGRDENRIVHVKYEIATETNKSTLKVFNDPLDGSYSISIAMRALEDGREYASSYVSGDFHGETCDFGEEQLRELVGCLAEKYSGLRREKPRWEKPTPEPKWEKPTPGEPVIVFSEEIWRFVPEEKREAVNYLLEILTGTFRDDPETFTQAIDQLEQQIGLAGVSRFISIGSMERGHAENFAGQVDDLGRKQPVATALIVLGIGFLVGRLTAAIGRRRR